MMGEVEVSLTTAGAAPLVANDDYPVNRNKFKRLLLELLI